MCIRDSHGIYQDIASGISFEEREQFSLLFDEILSGKVCRVITMYRDRITRIGFDFFSTVFKRYGCEIIVINEVGSEELDYIEIDKECNSLLDCYCSSAKNKFLKSIEKPDR